VTFKISGFIRSFLHFCPPIRAIPHQSLKGIRSSPGATVERLEPGAVPESDHKLVDFQHARGSYDMFNFVVSTLWLFNIAMMAMENGP